jgi:NADH-quinone oxidoreductase subunit L
MLMGLAVASAAAVIYFTYLLYRKYGVQPAQKEEQLKPWQKLIYHKYYVDEIYDALIRKPLDFLASLFHKFFDLQVIDGLVNASGSIVKFFGSTVRLAQTGNIGFYLMSMVLGIVCIVLFLFLV